MDFKEWMGVGWVRVAEGVIKLGGRVVVVVRTITDLKAA
jgi:hypothetical protein